jgi:hypothetical protein
MRKWLLALALLVNHGMIADRAQAQDAPKEFTLTVTTPDLQVLSAGLAELPYKTVQPLMAKLQAQVIKQQQPEAPKVEPQK